MAEQHKDTLERKPQDDPEDIHKDKYSDLCQLLAEAVVSQPFVNKQAVAKQLAIDIKKNPYAIRLIYEFLKSYIEARANNFNDNYTKNFNGCCLEIVQ